MPGSATAPPLHGHVKFVPSRRKAFSFTPDPSVETELLIPLAGEVGDTPGANFDEVEQTVTPARNRLDVIGAKSRLESAASRLDA